MNAYSNGSDNLVIPSKTYETQHFLSINFIQTKRDAQILQVNPALPSTIPTSSYHPHLCLHVWPSSLATTHCSDTTRIQLKVLALIYRSHIGQAPRYLRLPSSAISLRPLRSLDLHDLFVPRARTSMHGSAFNCNHWPFALEPTP